MENPWVQNKVHQIIRATVSIFRLFGVGLANELFTNRTRPPLEVVHCMKVLGLTVDSFLSFKAHVKSICNRVNVKVAALRRVRNFIPPEVIVNIYKAFILPHFEYCAPVLVELSSGLSNKLELTNQNAIRSVMNMSKSSSYSDLLTFVDLKTLEHRRYSHALALLYKCMYNMGPINISRRCSYFVIMSMTLEALTSYINLPITIDLCIGHIFTSPQDY